MLTQDLKKLTHPELGDQAVNVLEAAEKIGVAMYAREASEFAPQADRDLDTVILVLRGEHARKGRAAVDAVRNLLNEID